MLFVVALKYDVRSTSYAVLVDVAKSGSSPKLASPQLPSHTWFSGKAGTALTASPARQLHNITRSRREGAAKHLVIQAIYGALGFNPVSVILDLHAHARRHLFASHLANTPYYAAVQAHSFLLHKQEDAAPAPSARPRPDFPS